ncbi:hypothetical protein P2318_04135 [Myxococcaceae bacterium GXIMD 01537]
MSRLPHWLLPWACLAHACSTPNPNVRVRELPNGRLQVEGPLAGPFKTLEHLAADACTLVTSQPGAAFDRYGVEYCALYYYSGAEDAYFLSYLSDVNGSLPDGKKYCKLPSSLEDRTRANAVIIGGGHSHPNNRRFSRGDLGIHARWPVTHMVDATTGRVFQRGLMVFHKEKTVDCSTFLYNSVTRVVSALREGRWVPIGKVYNDAGSIEMFEGQDWVP